MNLRDTKAGHWRSKRALVGVGFVLALLFCAHANAALLFQDLFANRQVTTTPTDRLDGNNSTATVEPNEPLHGGKEGGHSLWLSWIAPTNGITTFWIVNATNDTLLSAYTLPAGQTTVDQLLEVARNDDDPADPQSKLSLIQFGAIAGQRYEIAVDGYRGSSGDFRLRWDFVATTSAPPVIVSVPSDQVVNEGDTVTLAVTLQSSTPLDLDWRYNGNPFDLGGPLDNSIGKHTATLVITNFQTTNVGMYSLRIRMTAPGGTRVEFNTTPAELQINSEGLTNAFARDKLFESIAAPLVGDDGGGNGLRSATTAKGAVTQSLGTGVVRGYDGSQIFNTTFATTDPTEPHHCGFTPSASYWFTYQPPASGTAVIDTSGSQYDNVVASYTYTNTVTSYDDLISVTCDRGSAGVNASHIEFAVLKGQQYAVVVAGVNGAKGIAHLNYHLDTNRPPVAPTLTNAPTLLVVAAGTNVSLSPAVIGSAPLHFAWSKTNATLSVATNRELQLLNVAPADSGDYVVSVWNHIGGPMNVTMPLRVVIPPRLQLWNQTAGGTMSFATIAGQRYVIEQTDALGTTWSPVGNTVIADGSPVTLTNAAGTSTRFYRVRVE